MMVCVYVPITRLEKTAQKVSSTTLTLPMFFWSLRLIKTMVIYYISPTGNSCQEIIISNFSFDNTPVGWFAYSNERCKNETVNGELRVDVLFCGVFFPFAVILCFFCFDHHCSHSAGKPRASIRCTTRMGSPSFELPPQVLNCDQTLSDVQQNVRDSAWPYQCGRRYVLISVC